MVPKAQSAQSQQRRYLLVKAGGKTCAVAVGSVHRILRSLIAHPVPGSSPHLLGLAQYGGEPLAVLDLEAMLQAGDTGRRGSGPRMTLVVRAGGEQNPETVGLAVDDAVEVVILSDTDLKPAGPGLVKAEAVRAGELVSVVDLGRLAGEG